jgi:ankyrin repeat domain-containing protein 50
MKFKSTKPRVVEAALHAAPTSLNETYERMLSSIDERDRLEALVLLRWVAYAKSPLTLGELAEATIVDRSAEGSVDISNKGGWNDTLRILAGFLTIEHLDKEDRGYRTDWLHGAGPAELNSQSTSAGEWSRDNSKVGLAHYSVLEYLESTHILSDNAKDFHFDREREHGFLAQSCLVYIIHCSSSDAITSIKKDLRLFPLLQYAAQS